MPWQGLSVEDLSSCLLRESVGNVSSRHPRWLGFGRPGKVLQLKVPCSLLLTPVACNDQIIASEVEEGLLASFARFGMATVATNMLTCFGGSARVQTHRRRITRNSRHSSCVLFYRASIALQ